MGNIHPRIMVSFLNEDDEQSLWVRNTLVENLKGKYGLDKVMIVEGLDNFMDDIVPFLSGEPKQDFLICVCTPQYAKNASELHIEAFLPNLINAPVTAFSRFRKIAAVIRKGSFRDAKPEFLMHSEGILMTDEESDKNMERLFGLIKKGSEQSEIKS